MKEKLLEMLKENGEWSFTRWIAFVGYSAFLLGSFYLLYKGQKWDNYDTFANLTGGGGAVTQLVNKFINGKYNTALGEPGKPVVKEEGEKQHE